MMIADVSIGCSGVVLQAMKVWTMILVKLVAYFLSGVGLERDS